MEAEAAPGDDLRRDGVIQRFKYCYELSTRAIRVSVEATSNESPGGQQLALSDLIDSAAARGWLREGWPTWQAFRCARERSLEAFDAEVSTAVFGAVPTFLVSAKYLLAQLTRRMAK